MNHMKSTRELVAKVTYKKTLNKARTEYLQKSIVNKHREFVLEKKLLARKTVVSPNGVTLPYLRFLDYEHRFT